jgi:hypothetical protein
LRHLLISDQIDVPEVYQASTRGAYHSAPPFLNQIRTLELVHGTACTVFPVTLVQTTAKQVEFC